MYITGVARLRTRTYRARISTSRSAARTPAGLWITMTFTSEMDCVQRAMSVSHHTASASPPFAS